MCTTVTWNSLIDCVGVVHGIDITGTAVYEGSPNPFTCASSRFRSLPKTRALHRLRFAVGHLHIVISFGVSRSVLLRSDIQDTGTRCFQKRCLLCGQIWRRGSCTSRIQQDTKIQKTHVPEPSSTEFDPSFEPLLESEFEGCGSGLPILGTFSTSITIRFSAEEALARLGLDVEDMLSALERLAVLGVIGDGGSARFWPVLPMVVEDVGLWLVLGRPTVERAALVCAPLLGGRSPCRTINASAAPSS
jgi:hypothetical protein